MTQFPLFCKKAAPLAVAAVLCAAGPVHADERADLEQLHATTLGLIDALVENGILTREKADQLVRDATEKTRVRLADGHPDEIGKDGKKIVRVSYIPEAVRNEIRDEVKQEVLAQAKTERWGQPDAIPEWVDRFTFHGDMRMRYQTTQLNNTNTPGGIAYVNNSYMTRAADIAGNAGTGGNSNFNTQSDAENWLLRARFGLDAKLSDMVSAGIGVSTGNTTNRTSTNQTLGQDFNKYSLVLDRGFIKLDPTSWLTVSGGRIANPYLSTNLVWADDLNFEGIAATFKPQLSPSASAFFTAGWFPLTTDNPLNNRSSNLVGVQGGADLKFGSNNRLKFGVALYQYQNIQGEQETNATYNSGTPTVSDYATRYEYPAGFRQRGNTLFLVNAPSDVSGVNWGLASGFRELDLTTSLDLARFDPVHIVLIGDFVKNLAFSRSQIAALTGATIVDGKNYGYMAKLQVGYPETVKRGAWNVSLAYRYLGSDAVLDAFTDSDFGLGGTNNKGFILGANYGIDKNAWISARWLSSNLIDSMAPQLSGSTQAATKLAVDMLQVDLNARF